ncbi:MAG: DUF294 nucleotidyltransferase-like domain-containing protein [Parachlamydia sp.]|nr:DUF294 nucleotidyltransferase-like domain-containing protein [Parachlamydia sp.]
MSCERLLEMGLSELAQRSFVNALLLFERAVWASEQEKNDTVHLKGVECIGDLILTKEMDPKTTKINALWEKYPKATKIYACCLALLKEKPEQHSPYFAKLKQAEMAFLAHSPQARQVERLLLAEQENLVEMRLTKFPASSRELASKIKKNLMSLKFVGPLAKRFKEKALTHFLTLYAKIESFEEQQTALLLNQIDSLVCSSASSDLSQPTNIDIYRKNLYLIRQEIAAKLARNEPSSYLTNYTTEMLKNVFRDIIWDSLNQFIAVPCQFAVIGIGSMARGEMSPYSDVEFAILLEKESPAIRSFFVALARLIELKIIQFGETPHPLVRGSKSPTPEGFRMDAGGNTPLCELLSLVTTPQKLASYQNPRYFNEQAYYITVNALRDSCLIFGSPSLHEEYQKQVAQILNQPSTTIFPSCVREYKSGFFIAKKGAKNPTEMIYPKEMFETDPADPSKLRVKQGVVSRAIPHAHDARMEPLLRAMYGNAGKVLVQEERRLSIGQDYGYHLGTAAAQEFSPDLESKLLYQRECVVIKRELYRLPVQLLSLLSLDLGAEETNFWKRCQELVGAGKLSPENAAFLTASMDEIIKLRFESQLFYQEEQEVYYLVDRNDKTKLTANPDQLKRIKRVFQMLYPLHAMLSLLVTSHPDPLWLTTKVPLQPHDFFEEGKLCLAAKDLEGAINAFKKELASGDTHSEAQNYLAQCERILVELKRSEKSLNERVEVYKKQYPHLDALLAKGDLIRIRHLVDRFALLLNMNEQRHYALLSHPFSYLSAYIDTDKGNTYASHFLIFLIQTLRPELPKDLEIEWSHRCLNHFCLTEHGRLTSLSLNLSPEENDETYQKIDILADRLRQLVSVDHSRYPRCEAFLYLAAHFLRNSNREKARAYLNCGLEKVIHIDPARQGNLKIAIYFLLCHTAYLEENREEARSFMTQAVACAKEASHAVEYLEKRQSELEQAFQGGPAFQMQNNSLNMILPADNRANADQQLEMGNIFAVLPYLEKLLANDTTNRNLAGRVASLRSTITIFDQAFSLIPTLINRFEKYKDLDHTVTAPYTVYLFYLYGNTLFTEKTLLFQLADKMPAQFSMACFEASLNVLDAMYHQMQTIPQFRGSVEREAQGIGLLGLLFLNKTFSIFGEKLPKEYELECYLSFGQRCVMWGSLQQAEEMLKKALTLHQSYCPADPRVVDIYAMLGNIHTNRGQEEEAKRYLQFAMEKISQQKGDRAHLVSIYECLSAIAERKKDFKQAVLCFADCLQTNMEHNLKHNIPRLQTKYGSLCILLLSNKLYDDVLLLFEKTPQTFPLAAQKAIIALTTCFLQSSPEVVAPHLTRMAQACAIQGSQPQATLLIYRNLLTLMLRGQKFQEMQDVMQKAVEHGVPEALVDEFRKQIPQKSEAPKNPPQTPAQFTRQLFEYTCSGLPEIIVSEQLQSYQRLDTIVPPDFKERLLHCFPDCSFQDKPQILELAAQMPGRFVVTFFWVHITFMDQMLNEKEDYADMMQALSTKFFHVFLTIFDDKLPKDMEFEFYFEMLKRLGNWKFLDDAETLSKKALLLHETHQLVDPRILTVYGIMGTFCANKNLIEQAQQYYTRALKETALYPDCALKLQVYEDLTLLAVRVNQAHLSAAAVAEGVRLCSENPSFNQHLAQIIAKYEQVLGLLLQQNQFDEALLLIEKAKPFIPFVVEKAIIQLVFQAVQRPAAMVGGHLSRMAKTCAIKCSNIQYTMLIYGTLLDLMMRGQKIQEMRALLQEALQQGIPDVFLAQPIRFLEVNAPKS